MGKTFCAVITLGFLLAACTPTTTVGIPASSTPGAASATAPRASTQPYTQTPISPSTQTSSPSPMETPAPIPEISFNLTRFAQLGGSIKGISIAGDVAYVGMGPRLAEIDISQPEQPILMRQSEALPGLVTQVLQISEDTLLINAGKFLLVMNASPRAELRPLAQLALEGAITAMAWDEESRILYAGQSIYQRQSAYTGLIAAAKLSPENQFTVLNSVTMPEWPMSIALGSQGLYAGAEGELGGLYYVPVSGTGEMSIPNQVIASTPEEPLQPLSLRVIGERLYLCYRDIRAYDVTNPEEPAKIWTVSSGGDVVAGFSFVGDKAYYFGWTILSEYVQDVASLPQPILGDAVGETVSVTAIHNGNFLVAYNDLEIYADSGTSPLQLLGTYQAPIIHAIDATANDQAVYVVDNGLGASNSPVTLRAFSLADLTPLGQVKTELASWYRYVGIALEGDRIYLAEEQALWVYDIRAPQPVLLGKVDIGQGAITAIAAMLRGGQRLLVAAQQAEDDLSVLTLVDLSDWQNPIKLGDPVILDQGDSQQIIWEGTHLSVRLDGSYHSKFDTIYTLDFDGQSLELRESLMLEDYIHHLAASEGSLAVTGTRSFLSEDYLSMLEPGPLRELSQTTYPDHGVGLALIGDLAWIVVGGDYGAAQLRVYEVSDPVHPQQVEVMDIAQSENFTVPIIETSAYVVLANGSGGIELLEYNQ
ncbi:MAG: hypothetical protein C3F13_18375 [Anaerolineales bacterium]|nr:hypothetical protein [Anaerolineae bacterium]PWB49805.1 MAG: hypothetical protein C3F13_18375 [Anaerolineales bacterium]